MSRASRAEAGAERAAVPRPADLAAEGERGVQPPPGPQDLDPHPDPTALAALHAAAFTLPRPWSATEFAALLASPRHRVLADRFGLAVLSTVAGEAELLTIATAPEARRQGHGRRLLACALETARAQGAEVIFLEVAADNAAALALYRGAGFVAEGRRRGYYRDGTRVVDAVLMRRPLAPGPAP